MTPHFIRWELPLADGLRFVTAWWNQCYERMTKCGAIYHGVACRKIARAAESVEGEVI